MREQRLQYIFEHRITAILRGIPADQAVPVAQALYEGGIRLLEITFDQSRDGGGNTLESIREVKKVFGDRILVGAGTVLSEGQAEEASRAGAAFILSPSFAPRVIEAARKAGMVAVPGALTPTEIVEAYSAGADMVKVFPVDAVGGSAYLKAIMAPINHIPIMAVGGVHEANIIELFETGIKGVGVASGLVDRQSVKERQYDRLTRTAGKLVQAVNKERRST